MPENVPGRLPLTPNSPYATAPSMTQSLNVDELAIRKKLDDLREDFQKRSTSRPKVFMGIVRSGDAVNPFTGAFTTAVWVHLANKDLLYWDRQNFPVVEVYYANEWEGRNAICRRFLDSTATHLLLMRPDIHAPEESAEMMLVRDVDIITPAGFSAGEMQVPSWYRSRGLFIDIDGVEKPYFDPMCDEIKEVMRHIPATASTTAIIDGMDALPPIEMDAADFGVVLLSRKALETIPYPWFDPNGGLPSDHAFSVKAQKHDLKIWGERCIFTAVWAWAPKTREGFRTNASVIELYFEADYRRRKLTEELALFLDEPIGNVWARVERAPELVLAEWNDMQEKNGGKPLLPKQAFEFYKGGKAFVYDCTFFNTMPWYVTLQEGLESIHEQKVLDFGGGIGTVTLQMAFQGNETTYLDVPGSPIWDFAFKRIDSSPYNITMIDDIGTRKFDIVIAIDVFEHIPDFETELRNIYQALHPGGKLVYHNAFLSDKRHPMYMPENEERWDAAIEEIGFKRGRDSHAQWLGRFYELTAGDDPMEVKAGEKEGKFEV